MELGNFCDQIPLNILANFMKMIFMDMENMNERMEGFMKEIEKIIKWKEKENLNGLMGNLMLESIKMIKKKVKEFFNDLEGKSMKVNERMGSSMGKDFELLKMELEEKEFGIMERGFSG